eukprot:CAMPEP_0194525586 /NCGR_PEP_ID=MMETSP0253-20130528/61109_1 /TAXON_ID=2966 /ORGANISM="Noctiluca scintillans" /LENGTH=539 /DNA_ID=CAMNT_0039370335 /DNA_START=55 /DNA_END=1671 /DNA_ORIENTATION=+
MADAGWSVLCCFTFLLRSPTHRAGKRAPELCLGSPCEGRVEDKFDSSQSRSEDPNEGERRTSTIPSLKDACAVTCSRRSALAWRWMIVVGRLGPVLIRSLADYCVCGGPRCASANARRTRQQLEKLGPAFVKLGQAFAAREDILSDEVVKELRMLCDQVPAFPLADARRVVREELGRSSPVLPEKPIAAASLGQVYRVRIQGRPFALKVQRPGLQTSIARDVVVLRGLAKLANLFLSRWTIAGLDLTDVVDNWASTMWMELDYVHEAHTVDFMRKALGSKVPALVIPPVNWALTRTRVIGTEWVDGEKVTQNPHCITEKHLALGVEAFVAMILEVGLVHADPHAGNMMVTSKGQLCLLDFGMVVRVPVEHRLSWAACCVNLVRGDHSATLDSLIQIGFFPANCPRDVVLPVMSKIWTQLVACGSNTRKRREAVFACYSEIKTLVRRLEFGLPDYYVCLARALLTLEGIALSANCEFDIFTAAFPVALRAVTAAAVDRARATIVETGSSARALVGSRGHQRAAAATIAAAVMAVLAMQGW